MFYKRVWINRLSKEVYEHDNMSGAALLALANLGVTRSSFFFLAARLKKTMSGADHVRYGLGIETADGLEANHVTTDNWPYIPHVEQELYLKTGYLKAFFKDFSWIKLQSGESLSSFERHSIRNTGIHASDKPHLTCLVSDYHEIGVAFAELNQEIKNNDLRCHLLMEETEKALRERLVLERAAQDLTDPKTVDWDAYHARRELARSMRGMYLDQAYKLPTTPPEDPLTTNGV